MLSSHLQAIGRVGINELIMGLQGGGNGLQSLSVGALAAHKTKMGKLRLERLMPTQIKVAMLSNPLFKQRAGCLAVAGQKVKDKSLEITGLGDVHGGRGGLKGGHRVAHPVNTSFEELIQDVVFVRCDHQLLDGQAHHARHVTGAHIAKVAAGHRKTHARADTSVCRQPLRLKVPSKVVDHLREQTRPVDGVDRADFESLFEHQITRDGFDNVLAVIKDAFDGDVENILIGEAEHLRLLECAHAPIGAGHEDANAFFATHRVLRRAARVT